MCADTADCLIIQWQLNDAMRTHEETTKRTKMVWKPMLRNRPNGDATEQEDKE